MRPPPCCSGFWQPKTRKEGGQAKEAPGEGEGEGESWGYRVRLKVRVRVTVRVGVGSRVRVEEKKAPGSGMYTTTYYSLRTELGDVHGGPVVEAGVETLEHALRREVELVEDDPVPLLDGR